MTAQWPRPLVRARIGLVNIEQSTWRGSRQNAQDNLSGGKFNRVLQKHSVPEATDYDLWVMFVWTHQIQDEESFPGSIFSEGWKLISKIASFIEVYFLISQNCTQI